MVENSFNRQWIGALETAISTLNWLYVDIHIHAVFNSKNYSKVSYSFIIFGKKCIDTKGT